MKFFIADNFQILHKEPKLYPYYKILVCFSQHSIPNSLLSHLITSFCLVLFLAKGALSSYKSFLSQFQQIICQIKNFKIKCKLNLKIFQIQK